MKIIVINNLLEERHFDMIKKTAASVGATVKIYETEKDIPDEDLDADVVYGFGTNIAKKSTSIKWLCVPSAGVDFLMGDDCFANRDCILTNSAGAYGVTIAEHMTAVTLMMMRNLAGYVEGDLNRKWLMPQKQRSIKDSRITVLGTGDIGRTFAKRVRSFEPECIVGINRSGSLPEEFDRCYKVTDLEDILPVTDVLEMCLPATGETKDIMTYERMMMLPEGAYIVNVGRGSAIDEDALVKCLESGHLAGAALDVFRQEPLPESSPLWSVKNLLITPHVAGNLTLAHTKDKNVGMFCEDLVRFAGGKTLKYMVDRSRGY